MYIGHYKGVLSSNEFYSNSRNQLNFPTQVELSGERYILFRTLHVSSVSQRKSFLEMVKKYDIRHDVVID